MARTGALLESACIPSTLRWASVRGFDEIIVFVHAVDAGSFSQAAQRLQVSRSAVAKSVARLERRLRVRLFNRTTRIQNLTEVGELYYGRCVRALSELSAAEASLEAARLEPTGNLRVTAPVLLGRHFVMPIVLSMARSHPRLKVEFRFSDRVIDLLDDGAELAVRTGKLRDSSTLASRKIGTQRMVICAAPSYVAKHGLPVTIEDCANHVGIAYSYSGEVRPWRILDSNRKHVEVQLNAQVQIDDLQSVADAAIAGAGLCCLPAWLLEGYVSTGKLQVVLDSSRVMADEVHAVWPRNHYLPSKIRSAIDALAAQMPAKLSLDRGDPIVSAAPDVFPVTC